MSGFVVDSRTLVAVRDTLGRLQDQLVGMHTVIWHQHGTLGGAALESELEQFCGTWHYGVAELGDQLHDLTRRLGEAAAAYDRIEQRITHASGGASATGSGAPAGGGHRAPSHRAPATHPGAPKHQTATHHSASKHHGVAATGGQHYSGGAGLAPATGGASHQGQHKQSGEKHSGEHKQSGDQHSGEHGHPGVGSGTTVIPPGRAGGSLRAGGSHHSGSGSGVTVIGGGPSHRGGPSHGGSGVTVLGGGPSHSGGGSGSGTTTVDEKIHRAEDGQRAELAAALKMVSE